MKCGIILLVFISSIYCNDYINYTAKLEGPQSELLRLVGYSGPISINQVSWLVYIYSRATDSTMGYGAIISANWVICTSFAINGVAMEDIYVYTGVETPSDLTVAIKYTVLQIILHDNITGTKNALALVQICPEFTTGSKIGLPTAGTIYGPNNLAKMYSHYGNLVEASKHAGERCECDDTANWDPSLMFCLTEHPSIYAEARDVSIPVVIDNAIAGFLMIPQGPNSGEQVINLSKYRNWINIYTGL